MKKKEECGHVSPSSISGDSDTNCEETDSESVIVEKSPLTMNARTPTEEYSVDSPDDQFFLTKFIMKWQQKIKKKKKTLSRLGQYSRITKQILKA